jgi:hypothetical protein
VSVGGGAGFEGYVSVRYPESLNRVVLGLDEGRAIAGQGHRHYLIELGTQFTCFTGIIVQKLTQKTLVVAGPAAVTGELRWWVEPELGEGGGVRLRQTSYSRYVLLQGSAVGERLAEAEGGKESVIGHADVC